MATGYTYPVVDGEITKLNEFVWSCARAFFYQDSMPASLEAQPSPHHQEEMVKARVRLIEALILTENQAEKMAREEYTTQLQEEAEYIRNETIRNDRIQKMLDQVNAWIPPSNDHDGLKDFMIQQLTTSLRDTWKGTTKLKLLSGAEFMAEKIKSAQWDVDYHTKHWREDRERAANVTRWLQALNQSVERPERPKK